MKSIFINDKLYWNNNEWTFLQFCFLANIENIPRFCYHEQLTIAGNCRMCLIEDLKSLKPVVSCTIIPINNSVFYTISIKVKKARESMLEFLLINHPLDCPICCQGGECDSQDLTEIVGADRGRYYDTKRAILDKNLGPIIKTLMNRCIHCTRCIRFSIEIIYSFQLGLLGRGNTIEIGTYLNSFLSNEFQGNLIDICPVGALTSKLYSYNTRPWECDVFLIPNIFDIFLDNIRIELRGNKIMRILPVYNNFWKNEWLSDFHRYLTEKFYISRVQTPIFKFKNFFLRCSWVIIYKIINTFFFNSLWWLLYNKIKYFDFILLFTKNINFSQYNLSINFLRQLSLSSINQQNYAINNVIYFKNKLKNIFNIQKNNYIFLNIPFLRFKYPQLYLNIINSSIITSNIKHIFSYGDNIIYNKNISNITLSQIKNSLNGKNLFSIFLKNEITVNLITNFHFLWEIWFIKMKEYNNKFELKFSLYSLKDNNITIKDNYKYLYSNTLKIFYNIEQLTYLLYNSKKFLYIYQGSFIDRSFEFSNIILPITFGYEEILLQKTLIKNLSNLYLVSSNKIKKVKKIIWNNHNLKITEDVFYLFQINNEIFNNHNFLNFNYLFFNSYTLYSKIFFNFPLFLFSLKHYFINLIPSLIHSDLLYVSFNNIYNNFWLSLINY